MYSSSADPSLESAPSDSLDDLRRRIAELTEAVAARDSFIAVAAHELRNPMTPMLGQIELLLTGLKAGKYSPEQIRERVERVQRTMSHYVKRSGTLLDVSRIASGRLLLSPGSCDLAVLVREVVDAYADAARFGGSSLTVEGPDGLPGQWDRLGVEQIVDNLVSNAVKYGAGGPVIVGVEDQGETVRISVRDHGPGISPRDRERIFERFERAVGADDTRSGFGVGLWVVGQLVEAMEGRISVSEADGGGTVFAVELPHRGTVVRA